MITTDAPAKVILFGEHAVVYGQPAIAVPVSSLRARATAIPAKAGAGLVINAVDLNETIPIDLQSDVIDNALAKVARLTLSFLNQPPPDVTITVTSTIPVASGLGSGAAVTAAVIRAIAQALHCELQREQLNSLVYEVEKIYHSTPSGVDNTVVVYEQPVYFIRNQPIETLAIGKSFTLVIADTGKPAPTKIAVDDVRWLVNAEPERLQPILEAVGRISAAARTSIVQGDIAALGPLMTQNHAYLQQMGVSSPELDILVDAAMQAGAMGAKLSGGGRGGNMIALVSDATAETVQSALLRQGAVKAFITTVGA